METETENQLSTIERFAVGIIEEKFEELAESCEYRFFDDEGEANCNYHPSSVGYCCAEFCPRLKGEMEKNEG